MSPISHTFNGSMRALAVVLMVMVSGLFRAQVTTKQNAPFSIRGSVGIPKTISSNMFRTAFNGVYEAAVSANLRVFSNFNVGLGYQNTHLQNNKKVFVYYQVPANQAGKGAGSLSYNTRVMIHGGCLKLGYDFINEKSFVNLGLNAGFLQANYTNVVLDSSAANRPFIPMQFSAPYLQPELSVNFMTDKLLGFSLYFSYLTVLDKFDPRGPRFNSIEQVHERRNNYYMSWITLGFGFNVMLGE